MTLPNSNVTAWKPADDDQLRTLAAAGESCSIIAELSKRSHSSIRKRARMLKIKLARSRPGPKDENKTVAFLMAVQPPRNNWTPEEDRRLLELIEAAWFRSTAIVHTAPADRLIGSK
jgi:hypothetical protein